MIRNYPIQMIKALQNAINNGNVELISTYKDYSFLKPSITCSSLILRCTETNGKSDIILTLPTAATKEYIRQWKGESAAGHFLIKDYKKQIFNDDNTLYTKIVYTVDNVKYKALLRNLIEINDDSILDEDKDALITMFADITINDNVYSIIKILPYNNNNSWGNTDIYSRLSTTNDYEFNYSDVKTIVSPDADNVNKSDNNPLF